MRNSKFTRRIVLINIEFLFVSWIQFFFLQLFQNIDYLSYLYCEDLIIQRTELFLSDVCTKTDNYLYPNTVKSQYTKQKKSISFDCFIYEQRNNILSATRRLFSIGRYEIKEQSYPVIEFFDEIQLWFVCPDRVQLRNKVK